MFINEFHYDNAGTDAGEFIEIAGPAGTNLSGYSIVLYNGAAAGRRTTPMRCRASSPISKTALARSACAYPVDGIQNGSPDGIALVQGPTRRSSF